MKKCHHPNVVKLIEVLDDSSRKIYLVLEYLEKGEISWQDNDGNPVLTIDETRDIARDIISGLEYLHFQGIVHRDIKPANLLRDKNGTVKISDFGVSYASNLGNGGTGDKTNDELELAKTAGTPAFFAPELCATTAPDGGPRPPITNKIDIWAVGVTLFCLVFGKLPFSAENEFELFDVIATEPLVFPDEVAEFPVARKKKGFHSIFYNFNDDYVEEPLDGTITEKTLKDTNTATDNSNSKEERASEKPVPVPNPELDSVKDLLRKLLDKDPVTRIDIDGIKHHPWMMEGMDNTSLQNFLTATADDQRIVVTKEEIQKAVMGLGTRIKRGLSRLGTSALNFATGFRRKNSSSSRSANPSSSRSQSRDEYNDRNNYYRGKGLLGIPDDAGGDMGSPRARQKMSRAETARRNKKYFDQAVFSSNSGVDSDVSSVSVSRIPSFKSHSRNQSHSVNDALQNMSDSPHGVSNQSPNAHEGSLLGNNHAIMANRSANSSFSSLSSISSFRSSSPQVAWHSATRDNIASGLARSIAQNREASFSYGSGSGPSPGSSMISGSQGKGGYMSSFPGRHSSYSGPSGPSGTANMQQFNVEMRRPSSSSQYPGNCPDTPMAPEIMVGGNIYPNERLRNSITSDTSSIGGGNLLSRPRFNSDTSSLSDLRQQTNGASLLRSIHGQNSGYDINGSRPNSSGSSNGNNNNRAGDLADSAYQFGQPGNSSTLSINDGTIDERDLADAPKQGSNLFNANYRPTVVQRLSSDSTIPGSKINDGHGPHELEDPNATSELNNASIASPNTPHGGSNQQGSNTDRNDTPCPSHTTQSLDPFTKDVDPLGSLCSVLTTAPENTHNATFADSATCEPNSSNLHQTVSHESSTGDMAAHTGLDNGRRSSHLQSIGLERDLTHSHVGSQENGATNTTTNSIPLVEHDCDNLSLSSSDEDGGELTLVVGRKRQDSETPAFLTSASQTSGVSNTNATCNSSEGSTLNTRSRPASNATAASSTTAVTTTTTNSNASSAISSAINSSISSPNSTVVNTDKVFNQRHVSVPLAKQGSTAATSNDEHKSAPTALQKVSQTTSPRADDHSVTNDTTNQSKKSNVDNDNDEYGCEIESVPLPATISIEMQSMAISPELATTNSNYSSYFPSHSKTDTRYASGSKPAMHHGASDDMEHIVNHHTVRRPPIDVVYSQGVPNPYAYLTQRHQSARDTTASVPSSPQKNSQTSSPQPTSSGLYASSRIDHHPHSSAFSPLHKPNSVSSSDGTGSLTYSPVRSSPLSMRNSGPDYDATSIKSNISNTSNMSTVSHVTNRSDRSDRSISSSISNRGHIRSRSVAVGEVQYHRKVTGFIQDDDEDDYKRVNVLFNNKPKRSVPSQSNTAISSPTSNSHANANTTSAAKQALGYGSKFNNSMYSSRYDHSDDNDDQFNNSDSSSDEDEGLMIGARSRAASGSNSAAQSVGSRSRAPSGSNSVTHSRGSSQAGFTGISMSREGSNIGGSAGLNSGSIKSGLVTPQNGLRSHATSLSRTSMFSPGSGPGSAAVSRTVSSQLSSPQNCRSPQLSGLGCEEEEEGEDSSDDDSDGSDGLFSGSQRRKKEAEANAKSNQ